jgi:hypothetical protein
MTRPHPGEPLLTDDGRENLCWSEDLPALSLFC